MTIIIIKYPENEQSPCPVLRNHMLVVVRHVKSWREKQTYFIEPFLVRNATALLSWITYAHLVPLSVTKRHPVHFILNPGHVEYELGVLMV